MADRHSLYAPFIEPLAQAIVAAERDYSDVLYPAWEVLDEDSREHHRREAAQFLRCLLDNPALAQSISNIKGVQRVG